MDNQQHPITPPPELVEELQDLGNLDAIQLAYRAGADDELAACCSLLNGGGIVPPDGAKTYPENQLAARERVAKLRAARRPKPPSLAEEALTSLIHLKIDLRQFGLGSGNNDIHTIRAALERLQELEKGNE